MAEAACARVRLQARPMPDRSPEIRSHTLSDGLRLALLLTLGASACALARPAAEIDVEATAQDAAVQVTARAVVHAPAELIWQTLTDYDHLAQFVPGIDSSRVVSRQGSQVIVEQQGGARWLFFYCPIRVTVTSSEQPYERIDIHLLQGNLRRLDGRYRIKAQPDGSTQLTWQGLIEPDNPPLPSFIRMEVLRRSISDQFAAMVREIERRADLWSARSALSR
jgi:ribosome-associated toxin RatA of RatAB toxin-antitoxin module